MCFTVHTVPENDVALELCKRNLGLPETDKNGQQLGYNQGCWFGLNDRDMPGQPENTNERNFSWSDGSAVDKTFINSMWNRGNFSQPDDKMQQEPEDCVFFWKPLLAAGWHDRDCAAQHMFICKVLSEDARKERDRIREAGTQTAAGAAATTDGTAAVAGGGNNTTSTLSGASPAPSNALSAKDVATIAGSVVSGVAAIVVAAYTGWKWYHKRKQTLVKLNARTGDSFVVQHSDKTGDKGNNTVEYGSMASKSLDAAV